MFTASRQSTCRRLPRRRSFNAAERACFGASARTACGDPERMIDRDQILRELLTFYQEAGVDVLVGEVPIDHTGAEPRATQAENRARADVGAPTPRRGMASAVTGRSRRPHHPRA